MALELLPYCLSLVHLRSLLHSVKSGYREVKDSVPSRETASILAADLSPDHLSGPQRLREMHSAMVAREKSSLGGKDWRGTGNPGGRKQAQEKCPWGRPDVGWEVAALFLPYQQVTLYFEKQLQL